jgi:hypothetical protein
MTFQAWELAARESIRDNLAAYNEAGDRGRLDGLAATFAPDGVLELKGGWRAEGREAIIAQLSRLPDDARPRPDGFFIRHFVTNIRFVSLEQGAAQTTAYFLVMTPDGPDHWGRYRDSLALTSDGWRFAHRLVALDASATNSYFTAAT